MRISLSLLIGICLSIGGFAQDQQQGKSPQNKKGKVYIAAGWNRAAYTKSDIHFKGHDFNFTLKKVVATDEPIPFDPGIHLNPFKSTIPQTNLRIGYFIKDHYSISIGFDHMKYVLKQDQHVRISGTISSSETEYDGIYDNEDVVLTTDFIQYENTDGLNYINFELGRHDRLMSYQDKAGNEKVSLYLELAVGVGGLYPRTDSHLLNNNRNNKYHVAGFGTSLKTAMRIELFSLFYIQSELKGGYINMPGIRPTENHSDKAHQQFMFAQSNILFGLVFKLPGSSTIN